MNRSVPESPEQQLSESADDPITAALQERARADGARFRHDTAVVGIETARGRVRSVRTSEETLPADDVVLAAGIWGPAVAALAGGRLPLVPVAHP
ncbi:FAD-dependent oxidoreductase [Pseudonocardia sp.]|uniref:FAD-dependent oxidoreductase n=1 Tax=Pseudonocardia sp. TaxID=60912 RepID=UPI0031FE0137